jgi:cytochrome c oxidase subunit 4
MEQVKGKDREAAILNLILALIAVGILAVAVWAVATDMFKAGTDDLFLVLVCLLLALLFAINPLMWAYNNGWLRNPFAADDELDAQADAMEAGTVSMEHAHESGNKQNSKVWGVLIGLTAIEVFLAYEQVPLHLMLIILMGLSIVKAALIMAYFMHLKFERLSLILTIVPTLVILFCLLLILFPDSFRITDLPK